MTRCFQCAGGSLIGGRVRNEDRWHASRHLLVVADGVGGRPGGHLAAEIAVAEIARAQNHQPIRSPEHMRHAILDAHRSVCDAAVATSFPGMATTLTVVAFHESSYIVGHVGDSAAMLLSGEKFQSLTQEHTFGAESANDPDIPAAVRQRLANLVTRTVGQQGPEPEVDTRTGSLPVDCSLLLATDGVTKVLTEGQICRILRSTQDVEMTVNSLLRASEMQDGSDNMTAVVCRLAGESK